MQGRSLLSKYTWLIDTLRRNGRLTRKEINALWDDSPVSDGKPLNRRTLYNYRLAIADLFGLEIDYNRSSGEYALNQETDPTLSQKRKNFSDWLLETAEMNGLLANAGAIQDRIFLENVPSARENLGPLINAIKSERQVVFDYRPFNRSVDTRAVRLEPYLLKLFKQRWYVAGRNVGEKRIKTYALDRIKNMEITSTGFIMSPDFDPQEYFRYSFGIVVDRQKPRTVTLRTDPSQARYLRALPLHPSQQEMVHDQFSVFSYRLLLTPDLLRELMSLGPDVEILAPIELRAMLANRLEQTLELYRKG